MIKIPEVQARLKATGGKMEVMLGYSDSSKDAGPTSATLALHSAQERIAKWAESHDIDLTCSMAAVVPSAAAAAG